VLLKNPAVHMIEVPVLIVGGGPVGLTASILLSQHGIRSLLVERHPGTAIVPKARGINARTMEMYRQIGIEQAIRDAGLAPERTGLIVWTESLAGREIERRVPGRMNPANRGASPVQNCLCAQDDLEPVLRRFCGGTSAGRAALQHRDDRRRAGRGWRHRDPERPARRR
jgi:2-polyprenyl-6-methoxyphenol hydroxylase-like FAD-dependent oxidoreductase